MNFNQSIQLIISIAICLANLSPVHAQYLNMSKADFMRESYQAEKFMNETHQDAAKRMYQGLVRTRWATAHEYTQLAYCYLYAIPSVKDFELSEECARKATQMDPELGAAWAALAHARIEQGDCEDCIKYSTKALSCKKRDDHAEFLRARAYAALHRYKEALADLDQWDKDIGPKDKSQLTYIMEGEIYEKMGKTDEAVKRYKMAAPLHPEDSIKCIVRALKVAKRHPEAIVETTNLIKRNPADSDAYNTRGEFKALSKDWSGALEDFSRAIKLSPTSTYYRNRAKVYEALGKPDLAKKDLAEADSSVF